jgi:hypothetical protein
MCDLYLHSLNYLLSGPQKKTLLTASAENPQIISHIFKIAIVTFFWYGTRFTYWITIDTNTSFVKEMCIIFLFITNDSELY